MLSLGFSLATVFVNTLKDLHRIVSLCHKKVNTSFDFRCERKQCMTFPKLNGPEDH